MPCTVCGEDRLYVMVHNGKVICLCEACYDKVFNFAEKLVDAEQPQTAQASA